MSDFSAGVRVAAWQCLAAWHGGRTQVEVSANTTQVDKSSSPTQVGVSSSPTQVGVSSSPTQVGVSSSPTQVGMSSITTTSSMANTTPNVTTFIVFSAFSEQQNALNTSKALMFSVSDEDHEVQTCAVQAAEQVLTAALGAMCSGPSSDERGGATKEVVERAGSIDFDTFFTRNWEEVHVSVVEQIRCSSERLLQLLHTGSEVAHRQPTEEVKVFCASLRQALASTLEAVNSSASVREESTVNALISTLKEIVSATEAEDSKFAEADCY